MNLKDIILAEVEISKESALSQLLSQSITILRMLDNIPLPSPATELKTQKFLKGLALIVNDKNKNEKIDSIIKIIQVSLSEFDIELSEEESIVYYSLRDQGRFKVKDEKLFSQFRDEFGFYKNLEIEKREFQDILKELKNVGLIDYRRGTVTLGERVTKH